VFTGGVNRYQREIVEWLQEENRVLREQLGGQRVRFTNAYHHCVHVRGRRVPRGVSARRSRAVRARPAFGLGHDRGRVSGADQQRDRVAGRRDAGSQLVIELAGLVVGLAE
jgi:hypothetical protein